MTTKYWGEIKDPIHGYVYINEHEREIIDSFPMQRLRRIRQLAGAEYVYPGATHTRFEHSLGVCHVANKICEALNIDNEIVGLTALLHDVGHCPFSHTLEYLLHQKTKKNHMELTKEMIEGERIFHDCEDSPTIKEILSDHGIDVKEIIDTFLGEKGYISEILHGSLDADQIDYLMRDAYYTGVAYGVIDVDRIIQTMKVYDENIVFERKGISSLESMLVARALMYSSVYLHKTVRIAELMLIKAVERAPPFDFSQMIDCELIEELKKMGEYQRDMIGRLKYRNLFKKAFSKELKELTETERISIASMENVKEIEDEIAEKSGLKEGYVIVDIPDKEIVLSEPRIKKVDLKILENNSVKSLSHYTPLANALEVRGVTEWTVMVCCPEKYKDDVAKKAGNILFD